MVYSQSAIDGSKDTVISLSGTLAILGALGTDAVGSAMFSPTIIWFHSCLLVVLDGVFQSKVGPTFKLGLMLAVHTVYALIWQDR